MSFYDLDASSKKTRTEQLVEKDADGTKQFEKVSKHSPGPVKDEELLARSLEYPSKFHAQGGLNDSLFQDAFSHGASAQRLVKGWESHKSDVHFRFEARAKARREGSCGKSASPDFTYVGALHMTAGELRSFRLNGGIKALVRVYDAGNDESDPLHAEIIADSSGLQKQQRHELRVRLMTLAEQRGLHVSPHLDQEGLHRAESSKCLLVRPSATLWMKSQEDAPTSS
ncbi:MAG: hypothetical protein IPN53_08445 [Comamonadaceae bacterium]|nr:hypothetical protein [Comamonadaceae bacterium]